MELISKHMNSPIKASLNHALEIFGVGLVMVVLLYFFRDDQDVREAVKQLLMACLIATGSFIPALIRKTPNNGVPDYTKVDTMTK